ncbi:hypothetical protein DAI22_01g312000 [Oryza sativa Japonica Group]|nr:hypothetical protein DAI22_01g312000 [Oryza sativa Japonica Group]
MFLASPTVSLLVNPRPSKVTHGSRSHPHRRLLPPPPILASFSTLFLTFTSMPDLALGSPDLVREGHRSVGAE